MAGKSKRAKLTLEPDELERLQHRRQAPTAPLREVQRAQILTRYYAGETVTQIARTLHMTRKSVAKWINRALAVARRSGASLEVVTVALSIDRWQRPFDLPHDAQYSTRWFAAAHPRR